MEPRPNATLPLTLICPIEWPGATMPPLATLRPPTVPVPPNVPPELTLTVEASVPSTFSVPALTDQFCAPLPVSVQVEAPTLLKVSKSRYCALAPIELMSNVALPVPPSCKVLLLWLAPVDSTLPLIALPGCSVKVLPEPVNEIAVPPVPVMVPELVMVEVPTVLRMAVVPLIVPELVSDKVRCVKMAVALALVPEIVPELVTLRVPTLPIALMAPCSPVIVPVLPIVAVPGGLLLSTETPVPVVPVMVPELPRVKVAPLLLMPVFAVIVPGLLTVF